MLTKTNEDTGDIVEVHAVRHKGRKFEAVGRVLVEGEPHDFAVIIKSEREWTDGYKAEVCLDYEGASIDFEEELKETIEWATTDLVWSKEGHSLPKFDAAHKATFARLCG